MNVFIAHGIHGGGKKGLRKIGEHLADHGYECGMCQYGWVSIIRAPYAAYNLADKLAENVHWPSVGIGFSNGCPALALAADDGAQLEHLILIAPALRNDWVFPEHVKRVDVIAAEDDWVLSLGKAWRIFRDTVSFGLLHSHPWGTLGKTGYKLDDPKVHIHWTKGGHKAVKGNPERWQDSILYLIRRGGVICTQSRQS